MKTKILISDDYAVLNFGDYNAYYGYEETMDDDWAFVLKKNDTRMMIYTKKYIESNSNITNKRDEPVYYLLAGLGMYFSKNFKIIKNEKTKRKKY